MKLLPKLLLISAISGFTSSPVFASIYRIDLNYGADQGQGVGEFLGVQGSLEGFMIIDASLDTGGEMQSAVTHFQPIPNWITQISLTFDPDNNAGTSNSVTKTKAERACTISKLPINGS